MAKTTTVIGTVSCYPDTEYIPSTHHPSFKMHVAQDGRAVVVYWYRNAANTHNVYAFRYSNADRTSWSGEQVIASFSTGNPYTSVNRISAWMDPSGHVHTNFLCYQNVRNYSYYCRLGKSGDGWTAGDVRLFNISPYDLAGGNFQIHAAHSGTSPWMCIDGLEGIGQVYPYALFLYRSDNDSFPLVFTPLVNASQSATHVGGGGGYALYTYLESFSGVYRILGKILWGYNVGESGPQETVFDTQDGLISQDNHGTLGLYSVYIGHQAADFVTVARMGNGNLVLRKYKIGTGWTNKVVLKSGGVGAGSTYGVWDADAGVMYFYWSSADCVQWNPNDDTVEVSAMPGRSSQMAPYVFGGLAHGFHASGSGGTSTLSYSYSDRVFMRRALQKVNVDYLESVRPFEQTLLKEYRHPLFHRRDIPSAATGWVYPAPGVPYENRWMIVRPHQENLVFENLAKRVVGKRSDLESSSQLKNGVTTNLIPIEWRYLLSLGRTGITFVSDDGDFGTAEYGVTEFAGDGDGIASADPPTMPIEWRQAWPYRAEGLLGTSTWFEVLPGLFSTEKLFFGSQYPIVVSLGTDLPLSALTPLGRLQLVPCESRMAESDAVFHEWKVLRRSLGVFPHVWRVKGIPGTPSISHQWSVIEAHGQDLPHLWRVLPWQLLVFRSEDIQVPYATVEQKD